MPVCYASARVPRARRPRTSRSHCITCTWWTLAFLIGASTTLADEGNASAKGGDGDAKPSSATESEDPAELPAGHSAHGEAFNEGPRQKAYLMGTTGRVHFPVSTENEEAQRFFDQGVGQLHGFWYFEAERSFRHVVSLDPECAMAYWGLAMANTNNEKRAKEFIAEAVKRREQASERERLWIDGADRYLNWEGKDQKKRKREYIRNHEEIIHEYPEEIEARAFLSVRLWQFNGDLPITSHEAVDALLAQVFAKNPDHPAHHFRIHLWDYEKPERALESAARCGQSSPGIAHMWHMPGHIFSRLKRYADAAWQQEASARTDHAHMMRDLVLPDQIHNYAHNNEWLIRNLIHVGRAFDALDLALNMTELPRHPKYNTLSRRGRSASYGRRRLIEVLEKFELWERLLALSSTAYFERTDDHRARLAWHRARGGALFELGRLDAIDGEVSAVESLEKEIIEERDAKVEEARKKAADEEKNEEDTKKAEKRAADPFKRRLDECERALKQLRGYAMFFRASPVAAFDQLAKAGIDDRRKLRLLLRLSRREEAQKLARERVEKREGEVLPLADLCHVLAASGRDDEAAEVFAKLRPLAARADLDVRPFARLEPIQKALGLPDDWREILSPPADIGERPALDDLGPFRWAPPVAPEWTLEGRLGQRVSLADYNGRAVVVIFYLGAGCLHCVEQLDHFAPKTEEFRRAGLDLVAISTEDVPTLTKALVSFEEAGKNIPFPLVANGSLDVFKAYRCYDDFEKVPLHGTFLIDAAKRIRWHDISYEPFDDPDFVIEEATRLLGEPEATAAGVF